jgi:RNase P subunit RPR2
MNKKGRKKIQKQYAKNAIDTYFSILESNNYLPEYEEAYVREIINLQTSFTIPLSSKKKFALCKNCYSYLRPNSMKIRLNPKLKTKEFICKNCGNRRRIPYKCKNNN